MCSLQTDCDGVNQPVTNKTGILQGMHPVVCINITLLHIHQHNNRKNNSLTHFYQLSLFNLRYSYATSFSSHEAIIRRCNI
jgi:hypothetical protein